MSRRSRGIAAGLLAALPLTGAQLCAGAPAARAAVPPIRHVFVIVLENENEGTSFGPAAPSPYLAKTLPAMGAFVPNYYGVGHASLDNYLAMISGQAPNAQTRADCSKQFEDFTLKSVGPYEQALGTGCVYPASVQTLAGQLEAAKDTWKGYMQGMPGPCSHPHLNEEDLEQGEGTLAEHEDTYATRHDPFVWFHSIIDNQPNCEAHVVNLSALAGDLASVPTTPNFSFITPDVCYDGHDGTCVNKSEPAGYAGIESFLSTWVPQIVSAPAFKQDGLLVVTFDESAGDSSACCGEPAPGGGATGAVLVSPFIKAGITSTAAYNHYGLLASIDGYFSLPLLGNAAMPGTAAFGDDIFNPPATSTPSTPSNTPSAPHTTVQPTQGCPSGRSVTIKLKRGLSHVTATVNGHKLKVAGKARKTVTVSLLHRSGTVVTVRINARRGAHPYRAVYRYKPCHTA
jgi:hypothetical protein